MAKPAPPVDYLESLLIWMRERPQMYCSDAGELDSVFWFLHMAWAKVADREQEYRAALDAAGIKAKGVLKDVERHNKVDLSDAAIKKVLKFWSKVDRKLGLEQRVDKWVD